MKYLMILAFVFIAHSSHANDTGAWFDPVQDGHGISLYEWNEGRVFWWFTFNQEGERHYLHSSVETGEEFLLYAPTVTNPDFPTGTEVDAGEPIGTATLVELASGGFLFTWDILVEEVTCADKYGPVPPGPIDPLCRRDDESFDGSIILEEGYDEQGSARFIRLTPGN